MVLLAPKPELFGLGVLLKGAVVSKVNCNDIELLQGGLGLLWKGLGLLLRQFTVLLQAVPSENPRFFWTSENSKPRILGFGV